MIDNLKKALRYTANFTITSIVASYQRKRNEAYCERYGIEKGGLLHLYLDARDKTNRIKNGMLF